MSLKTQVAKGAKWLDANIPGWASKINTKKLKMSSNTFCIMGQLAKQAGEGSGAAIEYGISLGLTDKDFEKMGFEADSFNPDNTEQEDLWRAEIAKRFPAAEKKSAKTPAKKLAKAK